MWLMDTAQRKTVVEQQYQEIRAEIHHALLAVRYLPVLDADSLDEEPSSQ